MSAGGVVVTDTASAAQAAVRVAVALAAYEEAACSVEGAGASDLVRLLDAIDAALTAGGLR